MFAHPSITPGTLSSALKIYDAIRRPFSQEVQRLSDENGYLHHLHRFGLESISAEQSRKGEYDHGKLKDIGEALSNATEWAIKTSALEQRDKAVRMFEAALAGKE